MKTNLLIGLVAAWALALEVEREPGALEAASGALRAGLFANLHPDYVSKLMLDALVWTGKDAPTLA